MENERGRARDRERERERERGNWAHPMLQAGIGVSQASTGTQGLTPMVTSG